MTFVRVMFALTILLLTPLSYSPSFSLESRAEILHTDAQTTILQFGTGFDETVIASSTQGLNNPTDLEFHPSATRSDELWVVNKADDSVVIIHDTGKSTQTTEKRLDRYRNHFIEEVSAIAFGSYHPEFDYQFATAQESRNTYNGQGSPNNFMGPALWPSALTHFAVEHQNDGLLGSHTDMLHESPNGMGIAHDSGNAYWYFDGYYGNLVYYDFQADHDTGEDDHSDGIVRRHTDIQLSRLGNIPGHMVMDQSNGILYISDTGTNRVLWVNTRDTSIQTSSMMSHGSRMEPLQEYTAITGREFGVLATNVPNPSGIALDGDRLFVSANGNGSLWAFDLSSNGKSATINTVVETNANSIMGIEIGPDSKLYYVDGAMDKLVRIDPFDDQDKDHIRDSEDNCPLVANPSQFDYDNDGIGNECDNDGDGDGVTSDVDDCEFGVSDWTSTTSSDYDGDGCYDLGEDNDDDNDGVVDDLDMCPKGTLGTISTQETDFDGDGCIDANEDSDDDNDDVLDLNDDCPQSPIEFQSNPLSDIDGDGCQDSSEDTDDDGDGYSDDIDLCPLVDGTASEGVFLGCIDGDGDGWADSEDVFPTNSTQWLDTDEDGFGDELNGDFGDACPTISGTSFMDRYRCTDSDGDGYSNPTDSHTVSQGADALPNDPTQWTDVDGDGYGDNSEGNDPDHCPQEFGDSSEGGVLGCVDSDTDGWADLIDAFVSDETQWQDTDSDGFGDSIFGTTPDDCRDEFGTSTYDRFGCKDSDGDGWSDEIDAFSADFERWSDADGDGYPDQLNLSDTDACPNEAGTSTTDKIGCLDSDGDGVSDSNDAYPSDPSRSEAMMLEGSILWLVVFVLFISVVAGILVFKNKNKSELVELNPSQNNPNFQIMDEQNLTNELPQYTPPIQQDMPPPVPQEGLPIGWTMEQWAYYGHEYLQNQKNQ